MKIELILFTIMVSLAVIGLGILVYNSRDMENNSYTSHKRKVMQKLSIPYVNHDPIKEIKSSGKTHVANYTKYRYNGGNKRDVEVWHSPTNIWVPYYIMFNTPFEDSCIRYNGEDVTGYDNTSTTR